MSWAMTQYSLVVMGSCRVGKSALTLQLVKNCPVSDDSTLGDLYHTHLVVDGELCELEILDTTGCEACPSQRQDFMRWGEGFLCVYAVDDIKSFMDVDILREELGRANGSDSLPLVLVANKTDMANFRLTRALGKIAAKNFRVPFMETSAKNWQGVEQAFQELVREIRRVHQGFSPGPDRDCPIM